jgi:spermidine synthase
MWKTFAGRRIYKSASGIYVFQNPFFRWLQFDSDAFQTVLNRYFPEKPGLSYLKPLLWPVQLQPSSCCMLGLGGAGAAHALSPFLNHSKLTIVEANAEVIDIARRYFMLDKLTNLNILHQDANLFVQECQLQFQYVLVDLFTADSFPHHCNTDAFFSNCKRLLKPEGILVVNLANRHEQWPIFQLIKQQFSLSTLALPIADCSNMIIFARNNGSITPLLELLKMNKKIKTVVWDAKWGCIAKPV